MIGHYGKITQGSILNNIKVKEFPGVKFSGVVITARCDIANHKINKYYYLLAAPVDIWIKTEGLKLAYAKQRNSIIKDWENKVPEYENFENYSLEDLINIIEKAKCIDDKEKQFQEDKEKSISKLKELNNLCNGEFNAENIKGLLKNEHIRSRLKEALKEIFSGKNSHYCFIPFASYNDIIEKSDEDGRISETILYDGIIVNLLEIDFFDCRVAHMIEKQDMDYSKLKTDKQELEKYSEKFYLETSEDIVYPEHIIISPYIEYVMQKFSEAFIRIGVDAPDNKQLMEYWKKKIDDLKGES